MEYPMSSRIYLSHSNVDFGIHMYGLQFPRSKPREASCVSHLLRKCSQGRPKEWRKQNRERKEAKKQGCDFRKSISFIIIPLCSFGLQITPRVHFNMRQWNWTFAFLPISYGPLQGDTNSNDVCIGEATPAVQEKAKEGHRC